MLNTQNDLHKPQKIQPSILGSITSFPNFAHWSHRIDILLGRMPVSKSLPFDWYNTPNVRVLTIADFEALASKIGLKILDRVILHEGANLLGSLAIYRVQSA
jgi:methionine biosynthesis protein MetW